MNVIKKTKQFVKDYWGEILMVAGAVGIGVGAYMIGTIIGENKLGKNLSDHFGIDLSDFYAYNTCKDLTPRELGISDELFEKFRKIGIDDFDKPVSMAIIVQQIKP